MTNDPERALALALDRIARAMLGAHDAIEPKLGELTLRPHQLVAVARTLEIVSAYRGALLADAVGLGKTYVGLAVARAFGSTLVVCPSVLQAMWRRAMTAAGVSAELVTLESLSRGGEVPHRPRLLIVDEAHHFRNPATRRYEALARLARGSRVLLMSATPLHNSRRDLTSLLALFLGSSAKHWPDAALARLVVRRDERSASQSLPALDGPHALRPADDDDCLEAILALPPTVPASDEGVAHALTTISLLHLWASSRSALVASMRKRLARATALRDALAAGHLPSAAELSAWQFADDALQLAFPLFSVDGDATDVTGLQAQLDRFIAAARALIEQCRASPDPDEARVKMLRMLRDRHRGERIVAFSQYAHTVTALGRRMRNDPGIACVTASGARIASGPLQRDEVLAQFAGGAGEPPRLERVSLLLATDLLSEGIDLRGASVVVNLDLPWNPARLEQRAGRSRRLGSSFERVHVYTFVPPVSAERMLQLRRRLTEKLRAARAVVGGDFDPFGDRAATDSPVAATEALRGTLERWLGDSPPAEDGLVVAAAEGRARGWLAAVTLFGSPRLIGAVGDVVVDDPRSVLQIARELARAVPPNSTRVVAAIEQIARWLGARNASAGSGPQPASKNAVLERLAQTVSRAPRHRRASVLAAVQRTRTALASTVGVGAERVMATLARSTADDDAWLQSVEAFSALHADDDAAPDRPRDQIIALVLIEPVSPAAGATPGRCGPS